MNTGSIRHATSTVSFGWMRLVQCVFVLLLAFDLVGSPFHQHRHEGSANGYSVHLDSHGQHNDHGNVADVDLAAPDHDLSTAADADGTKQGGHSLSALRGASLELQSSAASTESQLLGTLCALLSVLTQSADDALLQWRPDRSRPSIPLFRTVPPDGRAPPVLFA